MSRNSRYVRKALNRDYSDLPEIHKFAQRVAFVIGEIDQGKCIETMCRRASNGISFLNMVFQILWNVGYKFADKNIKPRFKIDVILTIISIAHHLILNKAVDNVCQQPLKYYF